MRSGTPGLEPIVHCQAVVVEHDAAGVDSGALRGQHKHVRRCELDELLKLMLALAELCLAAAQVVI